MLVNPSFVFQPIAQHRNKLEIEIETQTWEKKNIKMSSYFWGFVGFSFKYIFFILPYRSAHKKAMNLEYTVISQNLYQKRPA